MPRGGMARNAMEGSAQIPRALARELHTMKKEAIYAGTFDPMTLGHLDLVERASHIFDRVVLAVARKPKKITMFSAAERSSMAREATSAFGNVEVDCFDGLLVDYARKRGIHVLVRGLRAFSDFEYEFPMALTNRKLAPDIETIFLMPRETYSYVNSSVVREVLENGGDVSGFVPASILDRIMKQLPVRKTKRLSRR